MSDPLDTLIVPAEVVAALRKLRDDLKQAAGANLAGLILYGGVARGRYHVERSDINLVVLLRDASANALAAVAPALREAWRAVRVEPLVLTPAEVPRAADAFPTKFFDIRDRHLVLLGENPFAGLSVAREHVRLRIEQELRNLCLRLRRRFLAIADSPTEQADAVAGIARPLALQMGALLRFAGKDAPEEDRTAALLAAAAAAFDLDGEALTRAATLRQGDVTGPGDAGLFGRVLTAVEKAADVIDRLEESPR